MPGLVSSGIPPKSSAALGWPIRELCPPTSTIAPASFADVTRTTVAEAGCEPLHPWQDFAATMVAARSCGALQLSGGDVQSFDRAICAQFGSDDPQNLGMENQREMSDVAQDYDSREGRGMQHVHGRRGHDRI